MGSSKEKLVSEMSISSHEGGTSVLKMRINLLREMYRVESNMGGYLMRSLASAVSPIRLVRSPLIFNTSSIYRSKASHRIRVSFDTPSALSICC